MGKTYSRKETNKFRRRNASLYPIYKMISWDLLFFYSIEFLFLIMVKKVTASQILIIESFYLISKMLMQIPSVVVTDFIGKKNSIVLGNVLLVLYMLVFIYLPGMISVIIANFIFAFGYDIKTIAETNLLYDSVSTKGGDGLYTKLDGKGGSLYYILDGVASLTAGYLFVINNYLPMYICLGFLILSTILSCGFKDIYSIKKNKNSGLIKTIKDYNKDLKSTFKFILKSKRMKAFILFQVVFYSIITIIDIYQGDLLVKIGIPEEEFSMIFAILTFIAGIAISLRETIERRFKNRTLAFLSLMYVVAIIIIGCTAKGNIKGIIVPIILIFYVVQKISTSIWYILEYKYLKNFTKEKSRNKITVTYEFIGCLAASIASVFGGLLLELVSIENAFIIIGLLWLIILVLTLDYMRTRFGLKPEEYQRSEINF